MARPKGTKQLLAAVALILCALALTAAGLAVRRQQFDRTLALRFADDVSHGFGWGRIARQVGLFHVYDLQAAGRIDNPPNGLDYTPLRLTVMSGWAAWAERHYPDVTSWRNDYAFMAPVLGLNIAAEWASAVLAFTLVRHWVRKAAAARRPLEPPTPCTGTARGLLAAAFLWFNPAVIWDGTCFPQWDIWLAPFFLAAVLLGCTEWWLAAGCCVAVGAFLKGQILLVAPIFLIWPVAQGRLLPAARFAAGFVLAAAVIALPWMQPPAAGLWWLGFTALGIGLTAFLALDRRIPVRWPLAAAALGAAFAWPFGAAAVPLRALPPVLVVATVLTRVLPRKSSEALGAFAAGLLLFLLMPLFDASRAWYDVGFEFGTRKMMWMATQDTFNLPWLLEFSFRWSDDPTVPVHLPLLGAVSFRALMFGLYGACLLACGIGAAVHQRRSDPRFLVAMVAPWLCWFVLLPQLNNRYMVWAAGFSALFVGVDVGLTLLGLIVSVIGWAGIAVILCWQGGDRALALLVRPLAPHLGWALMVCAAVYLWSAAWVGKRREHEPAASRDDEPTALAVPLTSAAATDEPTHATP
jgi:hypothetical protein